MVSRRSPSWSWSGPRPPPRTRTLRAPHLPTAQFSTPRPIGWSWTSRSRSNRAAPLRRSRATEGRSSSSRRSIDSTGVGSSSSSPTASPTACTASATRHTARWISTRSRARSCSAWASYQPSREARAGRRRARARSRRARPQDWGSPWSPPPSSSCSACPAGAPSSSGWGVWSAPCGRLGSAASGRSSWARSSRCWTTPWPSAERSPRRSRAS